MALKPAKRCKKKGEKRTFVRLRPSTWQIKAGLAAFGYGQFARLRRRKTLKTARLPAILLLLDNQIGSYHFDPIYEFMT